jgi:hypothetical protein
MVTLAELEQQSLIWLEPKRSGSTSEKNVSFRENFRESFVLSPRFFRENEN